MILIFDVLIGFLLGLFLFNKKLLIDKLSIFITIFFYIILKSVILGIILGFFYSFNYINIIYFSIFSNIIIGFFLIFNYKVFKSNLLFNSGYIKEIILITPVLILFSLLLYNIIPFGGDELMYHLPISIELLNKQSWLSDLGLSYYWHNNIRQWYPKNLYFVIDYFFVGFYKNIIGIQIFGVFAFLFLFFIVTKINKFLFEIHKIFDKDIIYLTTFLSFSIPVIFLHFFVKVDIIFFGLILLFIYNLLIYSNIYLVTLIGLLIIGFKIIGVYYVGIISVSFIIYGYFFDKSKFFNYLKNINYKYIFIIIFFSIFFLYSFIYNYFYNGSLIYPINIIKTDNSSSFSLFGLKYYLRDYIYSDYWNFSLKNSLLSYYNSGVYNYDRGLGIMGLIMILGTILFLIFKNNRIDNKKNIFIGIIIVLFVLISFNRLNLLFGHRYQIFIYIFLTFIFTYTIYGIFNSNLKFIKISLIFLIFFNIISSYGYIGAFVEKGSGLNQLKYFTDKNYCNKLDNIGDISRDDFRKGWKFICENIDNKNILSVNQAFNFYLYGKNFNNKIYNNLFYNKNDFIDFIYNKGINYIITSNKNNLYVDYGISDKKIYTNTTDSNDESLLYCYDINIDNAKKLYIDYNIDRDDDIIFNFGINNFDKNYILNGHTSIIDNFKDGYRIENICINVFNLPKKSLDNKLKNIFLNNIKLYDYNGKEYSIEPNTFSYKDYPIEEKWLKELGYNIIFSDNFKKMDYFYLWKK